MTKIDIAALVADLTTKSAMINMGEKIAWGSETALMDQAAAALIAQDAELKRLRAALTLTIRADNLREAYHALPNDKNRIGEKRSRKGHARDAWLRAFRKSVKAARVALGEKP